MLIDHRILTLHPGLYQLLQTKIFGVGFPSSEKWGLGSPKTEPRHDMRGGDEVDGVDFLSKVKFDVTLSILFPKL